jgi:vitamin B12 transporter
VRVILTREVVMNNVRYPGAIWGIALVSVFSFPLANADEADQTRKLEPIIVTGVVGPLTVGESLSSVTEIEQEDIRRTQPREFSELLRGQPGVSVQTSGGVGQQTSVYVRGHESDATVLLVNGIRIRSATAGIPAWSAIPPQLVNRVEVVRAGRSSLYGSDAMGGVVQIFTAPQEEGQRGWVESGAGNLDTQQYGVGLSAVDDDSSLNVGINRYSTDGSAVVEGGEDKAYENTAGTFNASQEFYNGVRVNLTYLGADGHVEYEGGSKDFLFQTAGVAAEVPINNYWRAALQFSDARDEQTFFSSFAPFVLDTNTRTSRLENWFSAGAHEFVVGAETMTDKVQGSASFTESSRRNDAYFGQALLHFGPTNLHLSLRTDDSEAFGTHETWGAALGHSFGAGYLLRLNAGTSFRAPTFNDLYSPFGGNPDLEPEEGLSYEIGLERKVANWFWGVTLYKSEVENLIVSFFPQPSQNAEEAELQGIEVEAGWTNHGWSVEAALSAGDFENKQTGEQLVYRPEQTARLDIDRNFERFYLGTTIRAESDKPDRAGEPRISGYGVWDLRAGVTLAENFVTRLTVSNVLDEKREQAVYSAPVNYVTSGRTFMASVRYEFQL